MASKLITLPEDETAARDLLMEWIGFDDVVLLIVLGDTNIAYDTADRADQMTGGLEEEPRWVIHAPDREVVIDILDTLEDPDSHVKDWNETLFITLSITDVIRDMVKRDGTLPTFSRIDDAFIAAEID